MWLESASITLISGDLRAIVHAIKLSRQTLRKIKQNFCLFHNLAGIRPSLAFTPVMAGLAMAFSSVSGNQLLLLKRYNPEA